MRRLKVLRVAGGAAGQVEDLVTEEVALSLLVEDRRLAVLLCSPADLEDLVRGFLFTSGIVARASEVLSVVVNRATWSAFVGLDPGIDLDSLPDRGVIASGCGNSASPEGVMQEAAARAAGTAGRGRLPGVPGAPGQGAQPVGPRWAPGAISALMHEFNRRSEAHRQTGGVHAAALADSRGILLFREDIGRHNAVDKVAGAWLLRGESFGERLLLSSGRLSSEIVAKAARCGLPVVVSRSAPTDRAVALAGEAGITLIGFARGDRMNVYSGIARVRPEAAPEQDGRRHEART